MTDASLAAYLAKLDRALRSLPVEERASIIAEITSHIGDSVAQRSLAETLENLGDPLDLARAFLDQRKLEDAVVRSAHLPLLIAILEKAGRSAAAAVLGFLAVSFYLCAAAFAAMAVLKPILPLQVGLWTGPQLFAFAIMDKPQLDTTELLGYAIIPVAIALGIGSFLAGRALTRLGGRVLLRKSKALPD